MALRTQNGQEVTKRAIVAAGTKINLDDRKAIRNALALRQDWQHTAYDFQEAIGELGHAESLLGDALSRLDLFVARASVTPGEMPERAEDAPAEVTEALNRLNAPPGGLSEVQREIGRQFTVTGECYLVGVAPRMKDGTVTLDEDAAFDDEGTGERWWIASVEEIEGADDRDVKVSDPETGKKFKLDPEADFFARLWLRSLRRGYKAHSAFRGILSSANTLVTLERSFRAILRNRAAVAGLLKVPEELSFGNTDPTTDTAGDGEDEDDPFNEMLITALMTAIEDEDSAAALAPLVVRGQAEFLEALDHLNLSRPMDDKLIELMDALMRRIAQGLSLPVEFVFGLGEANHWGAGQIEEQAFRTYIEPLTVQIVIALTHAYLHPELRRVGVQDWKQWVVWYDPSKLITDSRKRDTTLAEHEAFLISDESARRTLDRTEDDAPTPEEVEERIRIRQAIRGSQAPVPDLSSPNGDSPVMAAAGDDLTTLAERLADLDSQLIGRLQAAADVAMRRVLEKAGNRLRSLANGNTDIRASLDGVSATDVGATLGRTQVASLTTAEDLLQDAWDDLGDRFERWTATTQKAALDAVGDLPAEVRSEALELFDQHRTEAWRWLRDALNDLAMDRLFDPRAEDVTPEGETDPDTLVPYGVVREAVSRAGGNGDTVTASLKQRLGRAAVALGIATGNVVMRALRSVGVQTVGWRWEWGAAPRQPFPPHLSLSGTTFRTPTDPVLANRGTFPSVAYYAPGDHKGCLCRWVPALIPAEEEA